MADVSADMVETNQLSVKELVDTCQECCTSFNPAQLSLDAHADAFLSARGVTAEADCAFIRQVLYGTVRFQALLKSFVDSFYRKHRSGTARVCNQHTSWQLSRLLMQGACATAVAVFSGEMHSCTKCMHTSQL